jgi:hypothetical protein
MQLTRKNAASITDMPQDNLRENSPKMSWKTKSQEKFSA